MTEKILDTKIAHDIMFGNTPHDMMMRAFENKQINEIVSFVKILSYGTKTAVINFERFMSEEPQGFYTLGQYTAYLTLIFKLATNEAIRLINEINAKLTQDNFIFQINKSFLDYANQ